ncbi:hypothetical protein SORBI_3001G108350 [Sorghum bicolor]|uniref:Uncharacterized protein n=1 Tax=Sorghum bicolor TaxID=4558 RepID=A0A1Z5S5I3_SORBI|nr:hypothetical protein SORBI_3001G108350 [Sorghum bicolor]
MPISPIKNPTKPPEPATKRPHPPDQPTAHQFISSVITPALRLHTNTAGTALIIRARSARFGFGPRKEPAPSDPRNPKHPAGFGLRLLKKTQPNVAANRGQRRGRKAKTNPSIQSPPRISKTFNSFLLPCAKQNPAILAPASSLPPLRLSLPQLRPRPPPRASSRGAEFGCCSCWVRIGGGRSGGVIIGRQLRGV